MVKHLFWARFNFFVWGRLCPTQISALIFFPLCFGQTLSQKVLIVKFIKRCNHVFGTKHLEIE